MTPGEEAAGWEMSSASKKQGTRVFKKGSPNGQPVVHWAFRGGFICIAYTRQHRALKGLGQFPSSSILLDHLSYTRDTILPNLGTADAPTEMLEYHVNQMQNLCIIL